MKRLDFVYISIVRRSAACASPVRGAHSARKRTLKLPPRGTMRAYSLILFRTTSIPRSSLLFISKNWDFHVSPNSPRARAIAHVVLPVPGGPAKRGGGRVADLT